jgi:hypothetical protein
MGLLNAEGTAEMRKVLEAPPKRNLGYRATVRIVA